MKNPWSEKSHKKDHRTNIIATNFVWEQIIIGHQKLVRQMHKISIRGKQPQTYAWQNSKKTKLEWTGRDVKGHNKDLVTIAPRKPIIACSVVAFLAGIFSNWAPPPPPNTLCTPSYRARVIT